MKTICRDHQFENKLTLVRKERKYFYLFHEKSINPIKMEITKAGLRAFNSEDWEFFENAERIALDEFIQ